MNRTSTILKFATTLVAGLAFLPGCGTSGESDIIASEMATATVAGAVQAANGIYASSYGEPASIFDRWSAVRTVYAASSCPTPSNATDGLNCAVGESGRTLSLVYQDCNFGDNSAVWNGAEILASSAQVSCGVMPSQAAGATLLRTFADGTTRTVGNSIHIADVNTSQASGYANPVAGGTLITYKENGQMSVEIKGVHVLSQKIFRGNGNEGRIQTEADHTVSTAPGAALEISSNSVVNGTVQVQHNLEKYSGSSVFKDVTFSKSKGCCLPQSGTITTTFSGSRTGTETLTFSGDSCGAAKLKDEKGAMKDLTLTRCF